MFVLAVVPVSLKVMWENKKFVFGLTQRNDVGITTYLFEFPSIPKLRWLNEMIRTLIGWRLYRIIRQHHGRPDLVHVHSFLAGGLALKIKRNDAINYAVTEHSSAFASGLLSTTEERLATKVFSAAIVRTAVSVRFAQLLEEKYGFPFLYIPNPVSLEAAAADIVDHDKKVNRQKIRICNVAYLKANKRHDRLIRAFNSVVCVYPGAALYIAGDGPEKAALEKLVAELGLESQVMFCGMLKQKEVFKLMCSCDVFALCSDSETFGVVLIEAMACGLPVVATKCGGPESIVTENWMGLLTEQDDESFAQGLLESVKGLQAGIFDARRISEHARIKYSCEAIGRRMTDILFPSE